MTLGNAWEQHAHNWIAWARTSPHDGFASGTWPELQAVLPEATADAVVVEIGSGEGRVARELRRLGHCVVGVELSPTLVRAAKQSDPSFAVVRADAAAVPIADNTAALVVACMSLQDIDDLGSAVNEIARILRRGGQLCMAIVHPFSSAMDRRTWETDVATVSEPYLRERLYDDHVERDGLSMTFVSQHRPLATYIAAFGRAGLMVNALREFGNRPIPWLLVARLEKIR